MNLATKSIKQCFFICLTFFLLFFLKIMKIALTEFLNVFANKQISTIEIKFTKKKISTIKIKFVFHMTVIRLLQR